MITAVIKLAAGPSLVCVLLGLGDPCTCLDDFRIFLEFYQSINLVYFITRREILNKYNEHKQFSKIYSNQVEVHIETFISKTYMNEVEVSCVTEKSLVARLLEVADWRVIGLTLFDAMRTFGTPTTQSFIRIEDLVFLAISVVSIMENLCRDMLLILK